METKDAPTVDETYVVKRNIVDEKELSESAQEYLDLMNLLLEATLERIVLNLGPFYP